MEFISDLDCEGCGEKITGGYNLYPEDAEIQVVICNPCWLVSGIEEGK